MCCKERYFLIAICNIVFQKVLAAEASGAAKVFAYQVKDVLTSW
jgi:hypothetical protein